MFMYVKYDGKLVGPEKAITQTHPSLFGEMVFLSSAHGMVYGRKNGFLSLSLTPITIGMLLKAVQQQISKIYAKSRVNLSVTRFWQCQI